MDQVETFAEGEYFPCEHKKGQRVKRRLIQSDPVYAAMIESLDENLGRLFNLLDALGETDNTVVFFTSDNGGLATSERSPTCNSPLAEGKGWMYEGGTREPLLVRWPGRIAADSTCSVPVTSPDFYPTILELADLDPIPAQHCDGTSIAPLMRGAESIEREAIFWHYPHYGNQGGTPGSSVRAGDYKLIEFFEDGRLELYNLRDDIGEERNLAEQMPQIRDRLHGLLREWREKGGSQNSPTQSRLAALIGPIPRLEKHLVEPRLLRSCRWLPIVRPTHQGRQRDQDRLYASL